MTGYLASLTPEQQRAILAGEGYDGPIGDPTKFRPKAAMTRGHMRGRR